MQDILIAGRWADFTDHRFGILLGAQTARNLGVGVGDSLRVTLPSYQVLPTGIYPRVRTFVVSGVFSSGSQLDGQLAFIRLQDAEPLFRSVAARRGLRTDLDLAQLEELPPGIELVPWQARLDGLYEAMQLEKAVVTLMLAAIIFIASFSLVASLTMSVAEKRTDIAVLRTMGASDTTVLGLFLLQGLLFGSLGILIGAVLGSLAAINLSGIAGWIEQSLGNRFFDPSVFYISYLPSDWRVLDLAWILAGALTVTLLASLVPAWHASRVPPAEAIHYNH